MIYTKESHIKSVEDVKTFFTHLVKEQNINFHPDDSFETVIDFKTAEPVFSKEEAQNYDRLMEEAFNVCEEAGQDIYEIGMNIMLPTMHTQDELIGKKIKIIEMVDEPRYNGKEGIVDHFDSEGQMHGSWGGLAVQPDRDKFEVM